MIIQLVDNFVQIQQSSNQQATTIPTKTQIKMDTEGKVSLILILLKPIKV